MHSKKLFDHETVEHLCLQELSKASPDCRDNYVTVVDAFFYFTVVAFDVKRFQLCESLVTISVFGHLRLNVIDCCHPEIPVLRDEAQGQRDKQLLVDAHS